MNIQKIYFETCDKVNLFGILHTPEKITDEIIISVHGMGSNCMKKRENIFAQNVTKSGKAYFSFNNRGAELMTRLSKDENILIAGTAFEEILDSHFDITAAINKMSELGYKKVHLLRT